MNKEKAIKELTDVITEWANGRSARTITVNLPTYLVEAGYVRYRSRRETKITYEGVTMRMSDWARKIGMPIATLQMRLRNGWSVKKSLTTPVGVGEGKGVKKQVQQCNKNGVVLHTFESIKAAAESVDCRPETIARCCRGEIKTTCGYVWKFKEAEND